MTKEQYIYLIYQQAQGTLGPEETTLLNTWLSAAAENQKTKDDILLSFDLLEDYKPDFPIAIEKDYAEMRKQMDFSKTPTTKVVSLSARRKWLAFAAAISLLVLSIFLLNTPSTAAEEWLVLDTTGKEQQSITLADGSTIWLNTNSQLTYPKQFDSQQRKVQLTGEAFFDIAKNPDKPFQIETARSLLEVLGTSFNVRAYVDEDSTAVLVKTGKVNFSAKHNTQSSLLTANQSASLNHRTQKMTPSKAPNLNALAWKSNTLQFKSTPLSSVFESLEKHFKITIDAQNPAFKKCMHSMTPQAASLDKILATLQKIYNLEIQQKTTSHYIITGEGCQ